MSRLEKLDKELWELVRRMASHRTTPFNPPLKVHLDLIENTPFEKLNPHLKDLARYLKLRKEEEQLLEQERKNNEGNQI